MQQQVLADRLDRLEHATVEPLGDPLHLRTRIRRLHLEPLADQHLQPPGGAVQGVAFGHGSTLDPVSWARSAAAGAAAATAWGLQEPLDQAVFRSDYSDIALLGKFVTRGPRWRVAGFALHALNGVGFGLAFEAARRATGLEKRRLAVTMALAEHVALYPLSALVDRRHPARGEPGVPPISRSRRAFIQATWRHWLFGDLIGRWA